MEDWAKVTDALPEPGDFVLVMERNWPVPQVLRYREVPFQSFLNPYQGEWYWYPETMIWTAIPYFPWEG